MLKNKLAHSEDNYSNLKNETDETQKALGNRVIFTLENEVKFLKSKAYFLIW